MIIVNGFQPVKQPGKHIVAIHILSNISRSKGHILFGQLIQYNMRNIFLKKSYRKCGGEAISRPFSKKSTFYRAYSNQMSS